MSGQKYPYPFTVQLVDFDNQIVKSDSASTIEFLAWVENLEAKALLESVIKVEEGEAKFENIGFASEPGSKGIKFGIRSLAVDPSLIKTAFGEAFYWTVEPIITTNFRECTDGEEVVTGYC